MADELSLVSRDSLAGGQTGRRELLDVRIEFPEAFFLRLQTSE